MQFICAHQFFAYSAAATKMMCHETNEKQIILMSNFEGTFSVFSVLCRSHLF